MRLDSLLYRIQHAQSLVALDPLLNRKTLIGNLGYWLFHGVGAKWSQRALESYEERVLPFVQAVGPDMHPSQITQNMVAFFLLRKEQDGKHDAKGNQILGADGKPVPLSSSTMLGTFRASDKVRSEFLTLIGRKQNGL